jgi:pimeloyl-ACP methyl ester carboxylesterase
VLLVTFDRPGYGRSDRLAGRRVADVADDVKAIADDLGLGEFAVLGRSGGARHALACAALLPQCVIRAAALVSLAPRDAVGLDWLAAMVDWGFKVSDIRVPVLLWRGAQDIYSPASHAQWLAQQIPAVTAVIRHGVGHFGPYEALPDVLSWLVTPRAWGHDYGHEELIARHRRRGPRN